MEKDYFKILDNFTDTFFPESGRWFSHCFNKEKSMDCSETNLPCHLRDVEWLVKIYCKKIPDLSESIIRKYISNSIYFDTKRKEYEQRIVKWQIDWMNNGGENWLVDSNLGGEFYMFSPYCDYAFRKGIVDTLLAIGMDKEAIEEGIEKNQQEWRSKYMTVAFRNAYNPVFYRINPGEKLPDPSQEHFDNWMKMRIYEYYIDHKDYIDKYGEILPEMEMSELEVIELKNWLENENKKRLEVIEEWKKNSKGKQKTKINF